MKGGVGMYVNYLIEALQKYGVESTIGLHSQWLKIRGKPKRIENPVNADILFVNDKGHFLASWIFGSSCISELNIELLSKKFDIIHFHDYYPFKARFKTTTVRTLHDFEPVCNAVFGVRFRRRLCKIPYHASRKHLPLCYLCGILDGKPPQLWRMRNFIEESHDAAVVLAKCFEPIGRRVSKNVRVIYTGIPPASDEVLEVEKSDKPRFIFVGRHVRVKGIDKIAWLARKFPKYEFVSIGPGGPIDGVKYLGVVSKSRLMIEIRKSWFLLLPSRMDYAPLVMLEAMSVGTPIIAVDYLPSLKEYIGEAGIFTHDFEEVLESVSEEMAYDLGEKAVERQRKYFTSDNMARKYYELYRDLLNKDLN